MKTHGLKAVGGVVAFLLAVHAPVIGGTITVPGDHPNIVAAVAAAADGDVIEISAGTYAEADALRIEIPNITLKAIGGEVVLNVPDSVDSAIFVQSSNVTVEGFKILRPTTAQNWMRSIEISKNNSLTLVDSHLEGPGNSVGVAVFHGADLTVTGTTFQNFNPSATWSAAIFIEANTGDYSDVIVDDCTFAAGCNAWIRSHNTEGRIPKVGNLHVSNSTFAPSYQPHGIRLNNGVSYAPGSTILFENCEFTGTMLEVVEMHYTSLGAPDSVTFRQCVFNAYNSFRRAMYLDVPAPFTFENVIWKGGQHESLIRFWGGAGNPTFNHCTLINDGVTAEAAFSGVASSTIVDGWDNGSRTFTFRNSLLYSPTNHSAALFGDWSSEDNRQYDLDYTIVDHGTPVDGFAVLNSGSNYSQQPILFVDAANRILELQEGSPAVDSGMDLGIHVDALGRPRPNGTGPDLGGLELQSGIIIQSRDVLSIF
jgi:hypothetical protein